MIDRSGQHLGNYRLVQQLGKGGFAEVYLGEHGYLKTYAALKILNTSLDEASTERFLSEAQTLGRLRHPHIVRVLEFSVEQGTPVLVMDYAPGGTLRNLHPRGSRLPIQTVVTYVKQMASALQYAHNHNVIHRDVKPENILLETDDHLLLSDFGISLLAPSPELLDTQAPAGTMPYSAPEQLRGRSSFASDQYALAIVAYEWLCGVRPFEGTRWEIAQQHLFNAPVPPSQKRPDLPLGIEDIIMRALAKDPAYRFSRVQDFAGALEYAALHSGITLDVDIQVTSPLQTSDPASFGASVQHVSSHSRTSRKVFLCASPHDVDVANRLKLDLNMRGVLLSNTLQSASEESIDQDESIQQAVRAADLVLVVLSPSTNSSHIVEEQMRIANMYERRMIFVWSEGEVAAQLLPVPAMWGKTSVIKIVDVRDAQYERGLQKIISALEKDASLPSSDSVTPDTLKGEPRNPYKGLHAFTGSDAHDFFGRDMLIQELAETLQSTLDFKDPTSPGARLLTVVGPSGSGKSSSVMAGLMPALRQGALPDSENWIYLAPIVPGTQPLETLALTLARQVPGSNPRNILRELEDDSSRGLDRLARHLVKQSEQKVLLLIDQFEELFASSVDEQLRQHFIDLLITAVSDPTGPIVLILTLRADFYDRPMRYTRLGQLIAACHRSVLPMELRELRAVIERPAALSDVQLTFEGNLVGDLLFESHKQVGALPLLEFTLDQLFQRREGRYLTERAYHEIGGVRGALARHAEAAYMALSTEEQRAMARALFLRLIEPGASEQDTTRRRAARSELTLPSAQQTELLRGVAEAFISARLLTASEGPLGTTIEVSHEALIREWARLADWLHEARLDIMMQQAISADAMDWVERGKPADRLYHGSRLAEAQGWAERNMPSSGEAAFLAASVAENERKQVQELQRLQREQKLRRQTVNRQRGLIAVLTLLLLLSVVFASIFQFQSQRLTSDNVSLQDQTHNSNARALASQANYALVKNHVDTALLLSAKARTTKDIYDARDSLLNSLQYSPRLLKILRPPTVVNQLVALQGNQGLISLSNEGDITLWQPQTGKSQMRFLDFRSAIMIDNWALSADRQTIAGAGSFGLWLWDARTGKRIAQLETGISGKNYSAQLAFSPDGKMLASSHCTQFDTTGNCTASSVLLWNKTSMAAPKPGGQEIVRETFPVGSLVFTPDGKQLIISSSTPQAQDSTVGSIQFYDIAAATVAIPSFATFTGAVQNVTLSADGKTLAATDGTTNVYLWDVASQKALHAALNIKGVQFLALSPDGKRLAEANPDNSLQLWNVSTGQQIDTPLIGQQASISSLTFSADGQTLASGDVSGAVLLWKIAQGNTMNTMLTYQDRVYSAVYSPDDRVIATGDDKGAVVLRDRATGNVLATFNTASGPVISTNVANAAVDGPLVIEALAFSPDGRSLAAGRFDGKIFLWNVTTRKLSAQFASGTHLKYIAFQPGGHNLAASYDTGAILLWNTDTASIIQRFKHPAQNSNGTSALAFNAAGTILATGYNNGIISWDSKTGKQIALNMAQQPGIIKNVAFSPDGHTLASNDSNDMIMLWNASTLQPLLSQPLSNASPDANPLSLQTGLSYSHNGGLLLSGDVDSVSLWKIGDRERLSHAFTVTGFGVFTYSNVEATAFSPNDQEILASTDTYTGNYHVSMWNVDENAWLSQACGIANRNLTMDEWRQFTGGNLMYTRVTHEAVELTDTDRSSDVCWYGSTDQFAKIVLPACNQTVALNPRYGRYNDSQGIALALLGKRQEAATDFALFVQWAKEQRLNAPGIDATHQAQFNALIKERTAWIQQLKAGQNPITPQNAQTIQAEQRPQ